MGARRQSKQLYSKNAISERNPKYEFYSPSLKAVRLEPHHHCADLDSLGPDGVHLLSSQGPTQVTILDATLMPSPSIPKEAPSLEWKWKNLPLLAPKMLITVATTGLSIGV